MAAEPDMPVIPSPSKTEIDDFDNALSELDYNDPMSFFDVARRLEAVIVCEEGAETNHPASGCQIMNAINSE